MVMSLPIVGFVDVKGRVDVNNGRERPRDATDVLEQRGTDRGKEDVVRVKRRKDSIVVKVFRGNREGVSCGFLGLVVISYL